MKIAVITGASSGIGVEFAKATLSSHPFIDEIWVLARREDRLLELKDLLGDKIRPIAMDITDTVAIENYKKLLTEENAEVSLLINNAGFGRLGNFDELKAEDNAAMVRLNCEALTLMSAVTLPFMTRGSEIINVCSIASFAPITSMALYSSTKASVMTLLRALRVE